MATGQAIVEKALTHLKSTLTAEDNRAFSDTTLKDIWREARQVEKEQGARLDLRFMRRIEPFLQSLESYAGVLEVFCQGYSPMAFVWGPIKLMLQVTLPVHLRTLADMGHQLARNYTTIMDNIIQAFCDIANVLPRVDKLKATFPDNEDFNQVIGLIYSDIIEFHQRAYKFFRCKGWHFWFTFHWGLFERRFKSILHRLSSHCDLLDKEAAANHYSEMKKFRDRDQFEEEAFEQYRRNQMAESVCRWLSALETDQEEHLHRMSDNRQPGTCNWVLADPQIQAWIEDEKGDSVLWMTGIPGSGKSFLCSLIVQNLRTRQDHSLLYYFCGKPSSDGDTCALILRTLAMQLLRQNPDLVPLVHQAYLQNMSSCSGPALKKMLGQILPTAKVARIVIDGIDECDHEIQKEVLKSLLEIQRVADHNCRLLVSSRKEPLIKHSLLPKTHMEIGDKTSDGLGLYIKQKVLEMRNHFPEMDSALLNLVEQRLRSKANGMFLWVRLVIAMLTKQISEAEVELAIDQLPDGLVEAYGLILKRIDSLGSPSRDRAFRVLYWVCLAFRRVGVHEVADGIILHSGQTNLNRKTRIHNLDRDIVDLCAPLLEKSNNGVLELVHFSAREYLVNEQSGLRGLVNEQTGLRGPFINAAQAHLNIAFSCIVNLTTSLGLIPGYNNDLSEQDLETNVVQGTYGLQSYGHEFWADHTVAYLALIRDLNPEARSLICALEKLSPVLKHRTQSIVLLPSKLISSDEMQGLMTLQQFPVLFDLVSSWIVFKSKLVGARSQLDTLDAQQDWKLKTDTTYLSLIDARLCKITERLLMMKSAVLPSHIDEHDYKKFLGRFSFSCRLLGCQDHFDSMNERDAHEASHIPSFPCLRCDFAARGFRSRKDLEKHTRRYHMLEEDFEIPADLHTDAAGYGGEMLASGSFHAPSQRFRRWNEQGRKILQRGYRQVLAKVESEMRPTVVDVDPVNGTSCEEADHESSYAAQTTCLLTNLGVVRDRIDAEQYEGLTDFKKDLRELSRSSETASTWMSHGGIESFCDAELENATSGFPAFSDFDHFSFRSGGQGVPPYSNRDQSFGSIEGVAEQERGMASFDSPFCAQRTPYWSMMEEKEFPQLLERCGRNFIEIADHLKTKTVNEVDRHFVELLRSGRTDLSALANSADARLQQESQIAEPHIADSGAEPDNLEAGHIALDAQSDSSKLSKPLDDMRPYLPQLQDLSEKRIKNTLQVGISEPKQAAIGVREAASEPRATKRKPRRRALCNYCTRYPDGLRDEFAVIKHVERFHTATRRVWICEDISIDKRFLTTCKSCSASKRYNSSYYASKHLRQAHFSAETPADSLKRWIREVEEPNPNFEISMSMSPSIDGPTIKRRKKDAKPIPLPPLKSDLYGSNLLPSMKTRPDEKELPGEASTTPGSHNDQDETWGRSPSPTLSDSTFFSKGVLFSEVSFEKILPRSNIDSVIADKEGPPHRTNQSLIKPNQVPRLPHLSLYRKAACQDQVEALYERLDKQPVDSARYQEELESLTSLSRTLLSDLRDWRRDLTRAPDLPFSMSF